MRKISVERTKNHKPKPADQTKLGFGNYYTDHMFLMNYDEGQGWHNPRIVPYAPFQLDPAAMCLHYGQEVFEGLKAYKSAEGKILLFRPEVNMRRMNISNERLCIPQIDEELAVEAVKKLVKLEESWIPTEDGTSLYIRPFIIAVDAHVGVHPAKHLIFSIILSPVGAYYPDGLNPVKILVESDFVRSVKGGTGFAKTGGNYASALKAQSLAEEKGYAQVLWLDGIERKYIEEVGSMNVFFVIDDEIITPALGGSILDGVTRRSCIELLQDKGYKVTQRRISMDEIEEAFKNGSLKEAFGSGTAAVISPIGELLFKDTLMPINGGKIGEITKWLYNELTGIQWGKIEDTKGWTTPV